MTDSDKQAIILTIVFVLAALVLVFADVIDAL